MKVPGKSVSALLADPSTVAGILLYGSDYGLIQERSRQAVESVLGQDRDPFRLAVLPREEHGRLREELAGLPLGGGRRVIRIQYATDAVVDIIAVSRARIADVLVIVEAAATLSLRSKLRVMAERGKDWAAVPCFPDTASVAGEITAALGRHGLRATTDAVDFLATELEGDFARRQSELEKLSLYAAGAAVVDFVDASTSCTAELTSSVILAVNAALLGDVRTTEQMLVELEQDGTSGPGLLAVLAVESQRLLKVRAQLDAGNSVAEACGSLFPPIYPRQAATFIAAVKRWPVVRLLWLGRAIRATDLACKRAGARDFSIAARLLLDLAAG